MLIRDVLHLGTIDPLDRELIIGMVLGKDRSFVLAHPEQPIEEEKFKRFQKLIQRRETHEPLAYILGEKEFFGLSFNINQFTLIPRPETELLVEAGLKILQGKQKTNVHKKVAVIDVGTGSGCIIISLMKSLLTANYSLPTTQLFAIDISPEALETAKENARRHDVEKSITFAQSNLLNQIQQNLQTFDEIIVLANLPYLSEELYQNTEPTVQSFEPKTALVSGMDGLDHYRKLLTQLKKFSQEQRVTFLLEISPEQVSILEKILPSFGVKSHTIIPDLTGRSRMVQGTF